MSCTRLWRWACWGRSSGAGWSLHSGFRIRSMDYHARSCSRSSAQRYSSSCSAHPVRAGVPFSFEWELRRGRDRSVTTHARARDRGRGITERSAVPAALGFHLNGLPYVVDANCGISCPVVHGRRSLSRGGKRHPPGRAARRAVTRAAPERATRKGGFSSIAGQTRTYVDRIRRERRRPVTSYRMEKLRMTSAFHPRTT